MTADSAFTGDRRTEDGSRLILALDIDFLPEPYRRRRLTLSRVLPALLVLGFALSLIPMSRLWQGTRLARAAVAADLAQVQAELRDYQPLAEERAGLDARVTAARAAAAEIQLAYQSVDIQHISWSSVLTRVLAVRPVGVELVRLRQEGNELILEGLAAAHDLPATYAESLESLGEFAGIVLQSVSRAETPTDPQALDPQGESDLPAETAYYFEISAFLPAAEPPAAAVAP